MASPEQIEDQVKSPASKATGVTLEDFYEAGARLNSCAALRDQLSRIPDSEREAALINMTATNIVRRRGNPVLPTIVLATVKGGTEFQFTACDKKP
jgi:hypothetical protein